MFAAVLMLAISCSDYDDSALLGRVDELEGRVDGYEQRLSELESKVNNINESYKALTAMLNGGVITSVEPFEDVTGTGYVITVQYAAGTPLTYKIYNGVNGETGDAPSVELKQDEDGRYYWVINGEEPAAERIYADMVTPQLHLDEDGNFQISYDGGKTWEDIGVFSGEVGSDITMEVEKDEKGNVIAVTFIQGENEWTYEVGSSNIAVTLTVDGKDVKPFSTVAIPQGATKTITVAVEGASENAVVTAELQNAGGYNVSVEDMEITVNNENGDDNKLIINVLDGGACYHTWVSLAASDSVAYEAWIEIAETDEYSYMPIAFGVNSKGEDFTAFNNVPVKPTITLCIDNPAKDDMEITLNVTEYEEYKKYGDDMPFMDESLYTMPSTVTIKKGETSVDIPFVIENRSELKCDSYVYFDVIADDIKCEFGGMLCIANNFAIKADLTKDNYSCPFDAVESDEGNGIPALVDDDPNTFLGTFYWADEDAYTIYANAISTYGVFVDVELDTALPFIKFRYQNRAGLNGQPRALKIGAEVNGEYKVIGEKTTDFDEANSAWNETAVFSTENATKLRFGVTESQTQQYNDLTTNPAGSMTLAELQVWVMY